MAARHLLLMAAGMLAMGAACAVGMDAAEEDAAALAVQAAVDAVAPALVRIEVLSGGGEFAASPRGATTGMWLPERRLVLTSDWLFAQDPSGILVTWHDGMRGSAKILGRDKTRALVALEVAGPVPAAADGVHWAAAEREQVRVGQWAVALGCPFADAPVHRALGIVSAVDRLWGRALQTDARISPHNYGGPLLDIRGKLLGLIVPLAPELGAEGPMYDSGVGFAVPWGDVLAVLPRLASGETLRPGRAGLSLTARDPLATIPPLGLVPAGSPAQLAGMQTGDVITRVNQQPVARMAQLWRQVLGRYAGEHVVISYRRGDDEHTVELELVAELPPVAPGFLGLWPAADGEGPGVAVRGVWPAGAAEQGGVQPGDVLAKIDGEVVPDLRDLEQRLVAAAAAQAWQLSVLRQGAPLDLNVTLQGWPAEMPAAATADAPGVPGAERAAVESWIVADTANRAVWVEATAAQERDAAGLLVWLSDGLPGAALEEEARHIASQLPELARWHLLVLGPGAGELWRTGDERFVRAALRQAVGGRQIDRRRVVVVGAGRGVSTATALCLGKKAVGGFFRGLVVWGSGTPRSGDSEEPGRRLWVGVAPPAGGAAAQIEHRRQAALRTAGLGLIELPAIAHPGKEPAGAAWQALNAWLSAQTAL